MSANRITLAAFTVMALRGPFAMAQVTSAPLAPRAAESFESVNSEWKDVLKVYRDEYKAAYDAAKKKGDAAAKAFRFDKPLPLATFSHRFLAVAERDPEGPDAVEALMMTLRTSHGPKEGGVLETRGKAFKILHDYYATKPSIKKFLPTLFSIDQEDSKALVADVIARNPDRTVQAAAYKELIANAEGLAGRAETLKKDPKVRATVERQSGKAYVAEMIATGEKAKLELNGLRKTLREKFSDVVSDLSIGNAAPEVSIQTVDGKELRLSALRGKVVVLDVWTTWCGPCKAMIPHSRTLVERLKGKPFTLVSISADEKKETLTDFLAKNNMPWTQCWVGVESKFAEDWDIRHYPTIYVIDANGVIRDKGVEERGDDANTDAELDKAVNALLGEAKAKPGA